MASKEAAHCARREEPLLYGAYGLRIGSELPLPELKPAEGAADITIRLGSIGWRPTETDQDGYASVMDTDEAYIFWEEMGAFLVREGREIVVDTIPQASEPLIRLLVLGQPMAALLCQRGLPVLHASTVAVSGEAVSFLGRWGAGKSTMAATMYARGHRLVADDVMVVRTDGERPVVYPGFPQLKLWPESAVVLGDDPQELPLLVPDDHLEDDFDKRARCADEGFSLAPLPLKCIYVLDEDEVPGVTPLPPQEALAELISYSSGASTPLQPLVVSSHFPQYASIVRNVAIRRLSRPRSLQNLPNIARLVEEDLAGA